MLNRLKQLLISGGSRGPQPSNLCLWKSLDEMDHLAKQLAEQANEVADWATLKQQLASK